ncbi:MAG: CDP-alcohol phosphatidyltransferase family protein [Kiritimatiellae bacterium]|nr:CDP-alcohol phosphatidyltransferase family protein [Kiritimatiellia bacterium]
MANPEPRSQLDPMRARRLAAVTAITCSRAPLLFAFLALTVCDMLVPVTLSNISLHIASRWIALALLLASSLTDLFDGMLARRWGVVTRFGAVCDPLMDKIFFAVVFPTVTALFLLGGEIALGALSLVFTALHLVRDMWVVTLRSLAAGKADLKADFVGKLRTATSFPIGLAAYCRIALAYKWDWLASERAGWIVAALFAFGLVLNVYSAISYTRRFRFAIDDALVPGAPSSR